MVAYMIIPLRTRDTRSYTKSEGGSAWIHAGADGLFALREPGTTHVFGCTHRPFHLHLLLSLYPTPFHSTPPATAFSILAQAARNAEIIKYKINQVPAREGYTAGHRLTLRMLPHLSLMLMPTNRPPFTFCHSHRALRRTED